MIKNIRLLVQIFYLNIASHKQYIYIVPFITISLIIGKKERKKERISMRFTIITQKFYYNLKWKNFIVFTFTLLFFSYFSILKGEGNFSPTEDEIQVPGYSLQRVERLSFRNSLVYHWIHDKTGATVVFIKNSDQNRFFSIGFKTFAEDNTGALHVLEHSILDGSEKYPIDFRELGSVNINTHFEGATNINRTVFKFSSNDEISFKNQSDVLCDYVFNPLVRKNPYIFYKQGIRRVFDKSGKLSYNGIVLNEMLGDIESDDVQFWNFLRRIFKHSYPKYLYGGEPSYIPDLTYEKILQTYDKFYYPSNSLLFFYGDVDIVERLQNIDLGYLSRYSRRPPVVMSELNPIKPKEGIDIQKVPSRIKFSDNLQMYRIYTPTTPLDFFAMEIIIDELFNRDYSPIKQDLSSSDFFIYKGSNIMNVDSSYTWTYLDIDMIEGVNPYEVVESVEEYLKRIAREDIDPSIIRILLNNQKYKLQHMHDNDGYFLSDDVYNGWVEINNPFHYLEYYAYIDILLSYSDKELTEYIKYLINKYILGAKIKYNMLSVYDTRLPKKLEDALVHKAREEQQKLSEEQIQELKQVEHDTEDFITEKPANLDSKKIPSIEIRDLKKMYSTIEPFYPTIFKGNSGSYLAYDTSDDKISHVVLYFNLASLTEEEIILLSLIDTLLSPVANSNLIKLHTVDNKDLFLFEYKISFFPNDQKEKLKQRKNTLFHPDFGNAEEIFCVIEQSIIDYKRNQQDGFFSPSLFTLDDNFYSMVSGFKYISYLEKLFNRIKKDPHFPIENILENVWNKVIFQSTLSVGIASKLNKIYSIIQDFEDIFHGIYATSSKFEGRSFTPTPSKKVGIISQKDIYQIIRTIPLSSSRKSPLSVPTQAYLLNNYLTNTYFYPRIINEGGAYSVSSTIFSNQVMQVYSKYDPNPIRTLEIIDGISSFMRSKKVTTSDELQTKIDTIAELFPPSSPLNKAKDAWFRYFEGRSSKVFQKEVTRMLHTNLGGFVSKCTLLFTKTTGLGSTTVVGNKRNLKMLKRHGFIDEIIE